VTSTYPYQVSGSVSGTYFGLGFEVNQGQGANSIAIGHQAAGSTSTVAPQSSNSIVINASGSTLLDAGTGTTVIQSLRQVSGGSIPSGFYQVAWNPTTGELIIVTP
jgi:hypothetical protein